MAEYDSRSNDASTAPTTPDGSLTFSPVLQATQLIDAFELGPSVVRNICCIGAGYVGGPSAAVVAKHNPSVRVTVVDRDESRIRRWQSNHLPIHENGLHEVVRLARDGTKARKLPQSSSQPADSEATGEDEQLGSDRQPNLFFSTDISGSIRAADLIFLAVNTPTKARGIGGGCATDMSALEGAVREIAMHAKPGAILVEKSTVPCGTADLIYKILASHRPGVPFQVLSNPEFLAEGTAIADLESPSRVLIGSEDTPAGHAAAAALADIYASWVPIPKIITINVWSSELTKLVANAMLAQRISSINSISAICEKTGASITEISRAVGLDPRIGPKYLNAGIGFGGSCFRKDILSLVYLASSLDLPEVAEYWRSVVSINEYQHERYVRNVIRCLNGSLTNKKISILGFAFKKDTGDTRDSLAPAIIKALLEEGPREIAVYDPCCKPEMVRREIARFLGVDYNSSGSSIFAPEGPIMLCMDPYKACENSSAVLVLTDCDEFRSASAPVLCKPTKADGKVAVMPAEASPVDLVVPKAELEYLNVPKPCEASCFDCLEEAEEKQTGVEKMAGKQVLDWARVASGLDVPKWVFDGRGVVEEKGMRELGVKVLGIGRIGG